MKRVGTMMTCLAGAMALTAVARADDVVLSDNPYAPIVVRNVFGLNPPPVVDPAADAPPPPKITPNGIMTILGQLQVLFKVAGTPKPGQPAKDESYILSEGQRQDDIEVTHIDEKASLVTFNNHGIVQELPLANAPASSSAMPAAMPPRDASIVNRFGSRFNHGTHNAGMSPGMNPGANDPSNLRNIPTRNGYSGQQTQNGTYTSQQAQNAMSPEEQMIMIAAQHLKAQQEGSSAAPVFPPTPIDKEAGIVTPGDNAPPAP